MAKTISLRCKINIPHRNRSQWLRELIATADRFQQKNRNICYTSIPRPRLHQPTLRRRHALLHTVRQHDRTERAGGSNSSGLRAEGFIHPHEVNACTGLLLHPEVGPARATTEGLLTSMVHLRHLGTSGLHQFPRLTIEVIMTRQIAGIMVGGYPLHRGCGDKTMPVHQLVQHHRMVNNRVGAGILITKSVKTVRAGSNNLPVRAIAKHRIQKLHIAVSHLLEEEFITGAPGGIPRTGFLITQDTEFHAPQVKKQGSGLGGFFSAILVGAGAANPEDVLHSLGSEVMHILAPDRNTPPGLFLQLVDPGFPGSGGLAPRVAFTLEVLEETGELRGIIVGGQYLVAAHILNMVDNFNVEWALVNTGTARSTRP